MTARLAAYAIALAASACLGFTFAWKWQEATYNAREAALQQQLVDDLKKQRENYERDRLETEMNRAKLIAELGAKNAENDQLRDRIDDISVRVRIKPRVCPGAEAADAAGADAGTAELDADARQAYLDLRSGIGKVESLLSFCRAELQARSSDGNQSD
jgi:hypothetical protein